MGILLPLGLAFQGGADRRHRGLVGGVEDIGERPPRGSVAIPHQLQALQLLRYRAGAARRPFADVFDPADQPAMAAICATLEGKTQRQQNPHPSASLAYAAWVCARLGGWTGYYGKPGPMVTLNGLLRFKAMAHGWNLGRLV